jgi:hypothetical protein
MSRYWSYINAKNVEEVFHEAALHRHGNNLCSQSTDFLSEEK